MSLPLSADTHVNSPKDSGCVYREYKHEVYAGRMGPGTDLRFHRRGNSSLLRVGLNLYDGSGVEMLQFFL